MLGYLDDKYYLKLSARSGEENGVNICHQHNVYRIQV